MAAASTGERGLSAAGITLGSWSPRWARPHRPHAYGETTTDEYPYLLPIEIQMSLVEIPAVLEACTVRSA
jgi:hypothetical protein